MLMYVAIESNTTENRYLGKVHHYTVWVSFTLCHDITIKVEIFLFLLFTE